MEPSKKPIVWVGDSKNRLKEFPDEVQSDVGFALYAAEKGEPSDLTKSMKGINAVEIVSDYDGDTFRAVYTTKIKNMIFVLHCFQKKSKKGYKTPKREIELIEQRLKDAEKIYKSIQESKCPAPRV